VCASVPAPSPLPSTICATKHASIRLNLTHPFLLPRTPLQESHHPHLDLHATPAKSAMSHGHHNVHVGFGGAEDDEPAKEDMSEEPPEERELEVCMRHGSGMHA
jgi:hypothetical protein